MTAAATHEAQGLGDARSHHPGPASKRIVVGYGFWIFLLSDIVMFSAFFASYAVLSGATAGGPTGRQVFNLTNVAIETACLLASSFTCGMCSVALGARKLPLTYAAAAATFGFGLTFLILEISEFAHMVGEGAGPGRSAFLSAFFTVVGCHGLHVTAGLIWLAFLMTHIARRGLRPNLLRRFLCFTLFWHALDIIWVGVFTIVYLTTAG
jgi:cytochrome o ubiquinol oxidase subunit 3